MDALTIFLKLAREAFEQAGAPPEAVHAALAEAEARARAALGGGHHHISRWPAVSTKARIVELAGQGVPNAVISERLGVSGRYVRRIVSQLRIVAADQ